MPEQPSVSTDQHDIRLEGDLKGFRATLSNRNLADHLNAVTLALTSDQPATPPELVLSLAHPILDAQCRWVPTTRAVPGMLPEWDCRFHSQMTREAPVVCFYNLSGCNRLTLACSEAVLPIEVRAGVHEESASLRCGFRFFWQPHPPITKYQVQLLIDTRDIPYHEALRHVSQWWETDAGYAPFPVPDAARLPLYSTWYSFHQSLVVADVVEQCRLARELGCEVIIVDDGWQTLDNGRGYGYTGDWRPDRIGDMKAFVDAVHDTGMKLMLWYSLPFAGKHSQAIQRFEGKTLTGIDGASCVVLDPRYPEVRAYLTDTLETAVRDWELDGFKLDFVDWFDPTKTGPACDGMDYNLVTDAAHCLLTGLTDRLRQLNPAILLEFRQPYIGPAMRRYANMYRAVDCPNDLITNRINTLDLRLLAGNTAVHSDMFMWNHGETAECAALQLLNVLFAVPQISVLIDQLPPRHRQMMQFWTTFWRDNRDVLLDGRLKPLHPECFFPLVLALSSEKYIAAVYDNVVVPLTGQAPPELLLVNATREQRIVIEIEQPLEQRQMSIFDCTGHLVEQKNLSLAPGVHALSLPPSGLMRLLGA